MASIASNLYATASVPIVRTEVISAEASTRRIIRKVTLTNISGFTRTVDIYIQPDGSNDVQIVDTHTLVDQETWSSPDLESHVLEFTGTLDVAASGTGVTMVVSGSKVT